MHASCRLFTALLLFGAVASSDLTVHAATRVDLPIDELHPNRSVPWPITTGVPFARGSLTSATQCRLVDDRGEEQPLQAKVAATWDAKRSSIRWLTIDFIAQPDRKYALEFGPDVEPQTFPAAIQIAQGEEVVVDTGGLQVAFSKSKPAALQSIRIDLDGDGKITAEEQIAGGAATGDHRFIDAQDRESNNSRDGDERQIVVESSGPVRTCVRVDGWYTGPQGKRIVRYRTRYHFFRGLQVMKAIDEFRIVGSTKDVKFKDVALPLDVQLGGKVRAVSALPDSSPQREFSLRADDSVSLRQETYRHYGNLECRGLLEASFDHNTTSASRENITGERTEPWLQLRGERAVVTGSLRWFWQQFPKEWDARRDSLTLHLWSPHVAPLDFGEAGLRDFFGPAGEKYLLGWKASAGSTPITDFFFYAGRHALERDGGDGLGINKHHEVWYHFGRPNEAEAGLEYGKLADKQPLCLPTGRWNVDTGVFGPLAARPNDSPYEAIVDRIFELERYAQDTFGDYGWWLFGAGPHYSYQWDAEAKRHVADPRRFEYHTYQRETQLWWNYLRSGERKFYDWAIPSENHWVDVAVSHVPTKYSSQWRGGRREEASLNYVAGDWSIDSPLHYVRHHDTGEAWLRSAPQLWASYHRTLETTTLAYFLTGDERYNDVIEFWRNYWGALAGVHSDSKNVPLWYREQLWWKPTEPGKPAKTWAEMIRDYAPFQSGSRHQMTLFFNLSTLYEHTWDEKVGQAAREFADAYLAPDNPNGTWQCHDHHLPANADSPMLAHYWSPALWKYDRATGDPRMPGVLKKYFTACIEADPYGEDVGIYSNNQIAWAWHFTKDPRHLAAAVHELDDLSPNAEPLEKPEDLQRRIYNPYAPIKALAATPRLIGILEEAKKLGVAVPTPPPLTPQRTWIAVRSTSNKPLEGTLWGWDETPSIVDEQGKPLGKITKTAVHRSHRQPFDRMLSGYRVFQHEFRAEATSTWRLIRPKLETGILQLSTDETVWCWAGEPIFVAPHKPWYWRRTTDASEIILESSQARFWTMHHGDQVLPSKVDKNRVMISLADVPRDAVLTISTTAERGAWFRFTGSDAAANWVAPRDPHQAPIPPAPPPVEAATLAVDPAQTFVPGRFGQGLLIQPGRDLVIPAEIVDAAGNTVRLADVKQGTIELWIKRLWDNRTTPVSVQPLLSSGNIYVPQPENLPLGEWAHVAVVWHPIPNDEQNRSLVHLYVDGVDYGNYRSIYWQGYSQPPTFSAAKEGGKQLLVRAPLGASFVVDELRFSSTPRYLNASLEFGKSQTFNPDAFAPPVQPLPVDDATTLYLPLDGELRGRGAKANSIEATLGGKKP